MIRDSFSKLIVWFKDKNVRTFYSLDWKHKYAPKRDRSLGLGRLRKKVSEWGTRAGVAELYDLSSGERIARFYEGNEIDPHEGKETTKSPTNHSKKEES